jgi:hypothetical protein
MCKPNARLAVSWLAIRASGEGFTGLDCISKEAMYSSKQDRPDVALARQIWAANQAGLDFQSLVFVEGVADEREADKPARQRASSKHGAGAALRGLRYLRRADSHRAVRSNANRVAVHLLR